MDVSSSRAWSWKVNKHSLPTKQPTTSKRNPKRLFFSYSPSHSFSPPSPCYPPTAHLSATSQNMALDSDSTNSEVNDFLLRIKQLGEKTYVHSNSSHLLRSNFASYFVSRDREDELRQQRLEQEIIEGRKRRQALRAERTRSLSPEKITPNLPLVSSKAVDLNSLESVLPPPSTKLSKSDEIKKTIASIAGPTGTLPLFPSSRTSKPDSSDSQAAKSEKKLSALNEKLSTPLKKVPFVVATPIALSDTPQDPFPPLKPTSIASPSPKSREPKPQDEETNEISTVKLKKVVHPSKPNHLADFEESIPTLPSKKGDVSTKVPLESTTGEASDTKPLPLNPIKQRAPKKTPVVPPPKPRSLSNRKSEVTSSTGAEEITTVQSSSSEVASQPDEDNEIEFHTEDVNSHEPQLPKSQTPHPAIISPIPDSSAAGTAGLRKFQPTSSHNAHDKVSGTVHGRVPLPGMTTAKQIKTPYLTSSRISAASTSTRGPEYSGNSGRTSPSHSPSRQSLRPNLTPSSSDLRSASLNPPAAGSFLATRASSTIVSRPASPNRGGFVQSAMLKREGTISSKPRSESSGNIFDGIVLPSPSARPIIGGSRSPSPSRHMRTHSTNTVDYLPASLKPVSAASSGDKHHKSNSESDRLELSPSANDTKEKLEDLAQDDIQKKPAPPAPRGIRNTDEKLEHANGTTNLKPNDSRRWSPVKKQTWLGSALMKNSPSSPPSESPNMSRVPTVIRAPSPTRHSRGSSISNTGSMKLSPFPIPPVSRATSIDQPPAAGKSPSPTLHSVTLSEPAWNEKDDFDDEEEDEFLSKPEPPKPRKVLDDKSLDSKKPKELPTPAPSSTLPFEPIDSLSKSVSEYRPAPTQPKALNGALNRSNSVRPAVPKKPDFGNRNSMRPEKPALPSDALEKLRALRSGAQGPTQHHSKPSTDRNGNDLEQVKASLRRNNTLQYQSSGSIRRGPRPVPPKQLSSRREEEKEEDSEEDKPALPLRPSQRYTAPRSGSRNEPKLYEEEEEAPPALPARKKIFQKTAEPLPPVPDSLAVRGQFNEPEASDPVLEARKILYGPSNAEKEADEKFFSATPNIPTVLNKKTAKSFASDLSDVLSRGKPAFRSQPSSQPALTSLKDTTKSFSPRFERMAGVRKSNTFDSSELSSVSTNGGNETDNQKVELKHMTKGRSKGPRGRRLPKNVDSPPASSSITVGTGRNKTHQRQRSRSLSPDFAKRLTEKELSSFNSVSHSKTLHPLPAPPVDTDNSDSGAPVAPPSRFSSPSNEQPGVLLIPKTRKPLPPPPISTAQLDSRSSSPQSMSPVVSAPSPVTRQKPVIRKSSQTVTKSFQNGGIDDKENLQAPPPAAHSVPVRPGSPGRIVRKPVKPAPAKPRKPSSSVNTDS